MSVDVRSEQRTTLVARPRAEGANIRTWIGFKHFMYLVEEGVLQWFREHAIGARALYHEHGLGLSIVDCSVQLPALLELDDVVELDVSARGGGRFAVAMRVRRPDGDRLALRGTAAVVLVPETGERFSSGLASELEACVSEELRAPGARADAGRAPGAPEQFAWTWQARYFHCQYSDRVAHSAYVRALEEVVERFLADRGLSIHTMLDARGWIPVVSRARVQLLSAAHMEEAIHTSFTVHEILKDSAFDATMSCSVQRGARTVPVATARILHGYAASRGEQAGSLVRLDAATQAALLGAARGDGAGGRR